jgi:hypothetical protein
MKTALVTLLLIVTLAASATAATIVVDNPIVTASVISGKALVGVIASSKAT